MADYISRQAAINAIISVDDYTSTFVAYKLGSAITAVKTLPSADAVEVRHGTWIEDRYNDLDYVCSECGEPCADMVMGKPRDKYCKWCGARMDGET